MIKQKYNFGFNTRRPLVLRQFFAAQISYVVIYTWRQFARLFCKVSHILLLLSPNFTCSSITCLCVYHGKGFELLLPSSTTIVKADFIQIENLANPLR